MLSIFATYFILALSTYFIPEIVVFGDIDSHCYYFDYPNDGLDPMPCPYRMIVEDKLAGDKKELLSNFIKSLPLVVFLFALSMIYYYIDEHTNIII